MILTIQGEDVMMTAGGDPALAKWHSDGAPVAGFDWTGDFSDVYGHGEMRLSLAAN